MTMGHDRLTRRAAATEGTRASARREVEDEQDVQAVPEAEAAEHAGDDASTTVRRTTAHRSPLNILQTRSHSVHSPDQQASEAGVATNHARYFVPHVALVASPAVVAATGIAVAFWQSRPEIARSRTSRSGEPAPSKPAAAASNDGLPRQRNFKSAAQQREATPQGSV